ncbi:hypothetical protein R5H32_01155 [Defluviimonas sp. D31]|jgi:hypothetical protein|uniref:Uncharacterized protein n=2 Tax=Albidovulum TaxID=205889 RepID=A0ABT3J0M0_9RHOB|nr:MULTISPECIES: hypothetical protein [Defluviimonas]MCU9846962.1 hypothetical protein [Defluviimonas sp. WL0024]MCW3781220.1 hypothetical protein [Defluviimonas salinarum]MDW4547949.1 hypothetical protein [Defluviimonas sp. D31]
MDWLIWTGALVTFAGLAALVWCILSVARARRENLPDPELRARLQRAVTLNFAALLLSALGLMMVVAGIMLG